MSYKFVSDNIMLYSQGCNLCNTNHGYEYMTIGLKINDQRSMINLIK